MLTDIYSIILIIIVIILLLQFDLKYILIIVFIIGLVIYYINNTKKYEIHNNNNNINNNNNDNNISDLINNIEKYKNINLIEYKYGMKYWDIFMNKYNNINNTYDYEKCESLLLKCIEHLKSLNLSSDNNDIIISINELYNEGNKLLKNKSKILNLSWEKEPNITKRQIIFDSPLPYNVGFKL